VILHVNRGIAIASLHLPVKRPSVGIGLSAEMMAAERSVLVGAKTFLRFDDVVGGHFLEASGLYKNSKPTT
jgi:hypothetical protein